MKFSKEQIPELKHEQDPRRSVDVLIENAYDWKGWGFYSYVDKYWMYENHDPITVYLTWDYQP